MSDNQKAFTLQYNQTGGQEIDYAKEKSMKKINDFLKLSNCQKYFWLYLVVGVLFSFVSIIVPTISGELVNAVVYAQKNVAKQFTILLFVYVLLLFLSIADQYCMHLYIVKQKKKCETDCSRRF